jgi:hypothetical protein
MVRKSKRKSSTSEAPDVKTESRSSRRKTSHEAAKLTHASQGSSKKGKGKQKEEKLKEKETNSTSKVTADQAIETKAESPPSNLSLGDRIDRLLPEELYRDDTSNDSDSSLSDVSSGIPLTIERKPLPWENEPDTSGSDSSDNEEDMNWETVAETELKTPVTVPPSNDREIKDVEITFEAPKSKNR